MDQSEWQTSVSYNIKGTSLGGRHMNAIVEMWTSLGGGHVYATVHTGATSEW